MNLITPIQNHTRNVCEVSAELMQATNILHQPATTSQPAREFYYQERDRTHSVVANVNTVIARFGKKG